MSAHAQHPPTASTVQPQRKPTGASDRLLAGAQYGLHPGGGVSDEPASFATGRLEQLTISPQSTLSSSSGTPPPLLPKIPANTVPQYTTSRSGSVSIAAEGQKRRVAAPIPQGQRPPSPPRRRVPPPLELGSGASSPLTPPLTPRQSPQSSPHRQAPHRQAPQQRTASGSRPLPQIPQGTPPPRSPHAATRGPLPESPRATQSSQQSPARAATVNTQPDAPRTHGPATDTQDLPRAATVDSHLEQQTRPMPQPRAATIEYDQPARTRLPAIVYERPRPIPVAKGPAESPARVPQPAAQTRAASIATEGPQTRSHAPSPSPPAVADQKVRRASQPRAATVAVEGRPTEKSRPSASEIEAAQAQAPTPPPKAGPPVPEKQSPKLPEKQTSASSAPAKVSIPSTSSSPSKPSKPTASASLPAPASAPSPAPTLPRKDRPPAQPKDKAKAAGKEPITRTSYLDPCLQKSLLTVPAAMTTTADAALSAVEAYPEQDFNWTIGAPIGGLGGLAKHYVLRPDAKFQTENGGISLTLAVVDERGGGVPSPAPTPGPDGTTPPKVKQGRTKARVEVRSDRGGILVDLRELDANRQIDLLIETRKGDVLLLLPENFLGPIHVRGEEPVFGSILKPQLDEVVNPYEDLWTTNVVPLGSERGAGRKNKFRAHKFMKGISKYVPEALREQDDYLDMAMSSYTTLKKGDQSKVLIRNEKGKVCVGLGGSRDAKELREKDGIKVGAREGTKKHWWS